MKASPILSGLYIYPVKSLSGIALDRATLTGEGLLMDRRWVVTDERGRFITQRDCPSMATLSTALDREHLTIRAPDGRRLFVSRSVPKGAPDRVRIFKSECEGLDEGEEAAAWLGRVLGRPARLKRVPPINRRRVSPSRLKGHVAFTGFADGYPLLVASSASLSMLNARLRFQGQPAVPMARFRPNLVLDAAPPFAEHEATALCGEGFTLWLCKPCERCRVITVDQASGEIPRPGEPLATLAELENIAAPGAFFGENAVTWAGAGCRLERGMPVRLA